MNSATNSVVVLKSIVVTTITVESLAFKVALAVYEKLGGSNLKADYCEKRWDLTW